MVLVVSALGCTQHLAGGTPGTGGMSGAGGTPGTGGTSGTGGTPGAGGTPSAAGDAAASCPPNGQDGPFLACVSTCNIDSSPVNPICVNGTWICPSGYDVRTCCRVATPPPPGCRCDPLFSVLSCSSDGGAGATTDARRDGLPPG